MPLQHLGQREEGSIQALRPMSFHFSAFSPKCKLRKAFPFTSGISKEMGHQCELYVEGAGGLGSAEKVTREDTGLGDATELAALATGNTQIRMGDIMTFFSCCLSGPTFILAD